MSRKLSLQGTKRAFFNESSSWKNISPDSSGQRLEIVNHNGDPLVRYFFLNDSLNGLPVTTGQTRPYFRHMNRGIEPFGLSGNLSKGRTHCFIADRWSAVLGFFDFMLPNHIANPKVSSTEIMRDLRTRVASDIESKYPEVEVTAEGQNREASKIADSAAAVFPAILFLIYVVIVFAFRSFSQPLILLALVPFSLIGAAWGHYLHGFSMSILSCLGIIGLIGIVVNDGLVFTNKFNSFLKEGLPYDEALYETGRARFRAIFLTSVTTIAGLAPLMLERSLQAQFLIPMAISIAYGIAVATILTLFLLPIFLCVVNDTKVLVRQLRTGKKPTREEVERAIKELKVENVEV